MTWEYRVETIDKTITTSPSAFQDKLNEFGQDRWEVITMEYGEKASKPHTIVLLKRHKIVEADKPKLLVEEEPSDTSLSSNVE